MKRMMIMALAIVALGCVKKETTGVYQVTSPANDPIARRAAEQAKQSGEQLEQAAKKINDSEAMKTFKAGAREAGRGLKQQAGVVVENAGRKLQEVGQDAQHEATTSAGTETITTTVTTTRTRSSHH